MCERPHVYWCWCAYALRYVRSSHNFRKISIYLYFVIFSLLCKTWIDACTPVTHALCLGWSVPVWIQVIMIVEFKTKINSFIHPSLPWWQEWLCAVAVGSIGNVAYSYSMQISIWYAGEYWQWKWSLSSLLCRACASWRLGVGISRRKVASRKNRRNRDFP